LTDSQIISERTRLQAEADAIVNNPNATRSELKRVDTILSKIANLRTHDEFIERMNALSDEAGVPRRAPYKEPSQRAQDNSEIQEFISYGGMTRPRLIENMMQEARMQTRGVLTAEREKEIRGTAMNISTGAQGAFFVPADFDFSKIIRQQMKQYDGIFDSSAVTFIDRDHGRPVSVPAVDYTGVSAATVAESGQTTPSTIPTVALTKVSNPSYNYRSLNMPVSIELVQDSFELVQTILGQVFSVSLARGVGADLINGNGTSAPQGLLTAAALGATSAVSGVVSAVDIESVYFSLNRISRNSPACRWLMNDKTYGVVKKLKDTANFPLIAMVDDEERLYGKPISICPSLPDIAVSSKSIILADLSQYIVTRTPLQLIAKREVPGYVEFGQVLVQCSQRFDAKLLAVGTFTPAVYLQTHA
jgi:HK97 family phage major capsid protein